MQHLVTNAHPALAFHRPWPRISVSTRLSSHGTCESIEPADELVAASQDRLHVELAGNCLRSAGNAARFGRASAGRSSALDGMHA